MTKLHPARIRPVVAGVWLVATLALPGIGCTTTRHAATPNQDKAALIIERSPDVFTASPLDNYPSRLPRFVLPVALNYDDAFWIDNVTSSSLSVGFGLMDLVGGPVFSLIQALGVQGQNRRKMDMLRNLMADFGTPWMSHDISSQRDQLYLAALRNKFEPPITDVSIVELPAELPRGRPDYKAVSMARASTFARLGNRPTVTVTTRPALLIEAGQASVMTRIEAAPGTWRGQSDAYSGEVIIYSQALGPALAHIWMNDNRVRFDQFYACAVAEGIALLELDIAGQFVAKKDSARLKDIIIDKWDRAYEFAGSKHVVAQRGHRIVVRVGRTSFGSMIVEPSHMRANATAPVDAGAATGCASEPILRVARQALH